MRMIDADALLAEYDRVHEGPPGKARTLIENAPTIEPERKKGKWIKKMSIIEKERYILHDPVWGCSCCNKEYDPVIAKMINFCPNCGADMRGEKDG